MTIAFAGAGGGGGASGDSKSESSWVTFRVESDSRSETSSIFPDTLWTSSSGFCTTLYGFGAVTCRISSCTMAIRLLSVMGKVSFRGTGGTSVSPCRETISSGRTSASGVRGRGLAELWDRADKAGLVGALMLRRSETDRLS